MPTCRSVDYSQLFHLHDPGASRPLRLEPVQDWINNQTANLLFYGVCQPPEPVVLKAYMGGSPTDFLWTGFIPLLCVSDRVVELLQGKGFSGWGNYSVEVFDRKGKPLPGYYGFAVKSYAGEQDLSRSQVIETPPIVPGRAPIKAYKGLYFDESRWDGSDIFRVQHAIIVVTQEVRAAFRGAKITNVRFIPLSEEETNPLIFEVMRKRRPPADEET